MESTAPNGRRSRNLQIKIDSEDRLRGKLSDVVAGLAQIAKLRDSEEAREFDRLTHEEQKSGRNESLASSFEASVAKLLEEFGDLRGSEQEDPPASELWEAEQTRKTSVTQAYSAIDDAVQVLRTSREIWESVATDSPRHLRMEELNQFLSPATGQGTSASVEGLEDPNEANARLLAEKNNLDASLADIQKARTKQAGLINDSVETLVRITEHRSELTSRRETLASQLSSDDLKIQVLAQADDSLLEADLRRLVQKSNSFDLVFSTDGLPRILDHPFKPKRDLRVANLKTLLKEIRASGSEAALLEKDLETSIDQRFFTHLKTLDEHTYQTEVNLWFPEDRLRVRYKQDGVTSLRELGEGSPGEKTAALLAVILQLSDDPLLLDQPEDDLDNKLIYDLVVATLRRIKTSRQVIVVTHNANVVVNADAEHVTILRHGTMPDVEAHGSIQEATMSSRSA